ncbi:hypothetical protein [Rhizomonospora bruguierae]|uniref:hypothetical protein n=1 Tax=Rhizomonospora bruguierae TaxID=1581705 RepID=UPI001BD03F72|nr:hypothetical protein [Micromonospora sp. NBRC 107566]
MIEIIDSVTHSGVAGNLAANYSISGLHFVDIEHCQPPYSVVTIETYGWGKKCQPVVVMWYQAGSGLRDEIVRPIDKAVPLFWRFTGEKFNIAPR